MAPASGLFEPILAALDAHGVRAVVVGGVATVLLIDMKRSAGRPQDMADIEALELIRSRGEPT